MENFQNEIIVSQKWHMKTLKIFCSNSMAQITAEITLGGEVIHSPLTF
jgi:hypothetical protein